VIPKEIYEGTGLSHITVEDWGPASFNMQQPFHALIYAWLVRVCLPYGRKKEKEGQYTKKCR
jgi:hypothetical protein